MGCESQSCNSLASKHVLPVGLCSFGGRYECELGFLWDVMMVTRCEQLTLACGMPTGKPLAGITIVRRASRASWTLLRGILYIMTYACKA